ncbi:MAG TPA: thioredoxin domain-containing protein [Gemmataceae bacterium]|nr:thioredoxin domain-containing protein [Gemmataceae bacterium]
MSQQQEFTNNLAHETSPYLKQHAHNPVDWRPWGPEALELARRLERPIFLSIGYSACHWCHVMEHESFEDPEICRLLNDNFVSIKVDREERPDLDQIYMASVQLLTRQAGGWPMSVWLTPDLKPFYAGTYFPPDNRYGRPSFRQVLTALADAWKTRRSEIEESSVQVAEHLQQALQLEGAPGDLEPGLLRKAVSMLQRAFDSVHGGFGSAPKFPHPMDIRLLLRAWKRFGDDEAMQMARSTLDHMARGGIYDHLGGGFHRYSTDERWLAPHFEKMLYDNALLSVAYLEAYQASGDASYRQVVEETLAYVLREMTSPEGPFYSTQDADSEGEEGKFYVWSAAEVEAILGKEKADIFGYVYDVNPGGNWEGHTILHRTKTDEQDARLLKLDVPQLRRILEDCKQKLLAIRSKRVWPGRDEKALTSWNALMITAFAQAAAVLQNPAYLQAATKSADFILTRMRAPDGRLLRTYSAGTEPKLNAYLEDYAFLVDALISLYEASFERRWIEAACGLAELMIQEFWDSRHGGFFFTGVSHETLIARTKDLQDSSIPSGNALAVTALLRLHKLTGQKDFLDKVEQTIRLCRGLMASSPMAAGQMLVALDFYLGPVREFVVVANEMNKEGREVLNMIQSRFDPNKVVAFKNGSDKDARIDKVLPLLGDKTSRGGVTTYICRDFACQKPVVGVEALKTEL